MCWRRYDKLELVRMVCTALVSLCLSAPLMAQQKGLIYTPTTRGEYQDDKRIGIWEFRDTPETIGLKIDYTAGELVYAKPDTSDFYVADGNRWKVTKLKIPCRPHGSIAELRSFYLDVFSAYISRDFQNQHDMSTMRAQLLFEVDDSGLASNPKLVGIYPDSFHSIMMEAFKAAPQFWIVGIDSGGNTVKSRLSILFQYCLDECESFPEKITEAKTILTISVNRVKDPTTRFKESKSYTNRISFGTIGIAQAFSPDDEHLLVQVSETINNVQGTVALIYKVSQGTHQRIPFLGVGASSWVDPTKILFNYNFTSHFRFPAIYDLTRDEVIQYSDSSIYFTACSPATQNIAFVKSTKEGIEIWNGPVSSQSKELLLKSEHQLIQPLVWSPNGKHLILQEEKYNLRRLFVWNPTRRALTTIPLLSATVVGWSADNDSLYMLQSRLGVGEIVGELYRYCISTDELKLILPKTNGLYAAEYSATVGKFALIIRDDLYTWEPATTQKPDLIRKKAAPIITWSNNGKMLAFYTLKDRELYIRDIESGKEKQVTHNRTK